MKDTLRRFINHYYSVVIMSLDQDFIVEAKRLHGWDISFNGTLYVPDNGVNVVNDFNWIEEVNPGEEVELVLGSNYCNRGREYDFVCVDQKVSQTIAVCHTSRLPDYHSELLEGVVLHLRQFQKGVGVKLNLPAQLDNSYLKNHIGENHVDLLKYDHPDYFGGEWHIITEGSGEIIDVVGDAEIPQKFC